MKASIALLGLAAGSLLLFPSCTATNHGVSLVYKPPAQGQRIARGAPVVDLGRFNDRRGARGTELGSVRNEVGIPLKVVHAQKPVAEIAHNAFAYALDVRGMLAKKNPRYVISADIVELWCNQYATQEAACRIRVNVTRRGESRPRFSKVYGAKRSRRTSNVSYWSRVEEMSVVTSEALQAVVDSAVDDPALRRVLR